MPDTGFIKRLEIVGGFFDEFVIEFAEGLNCIIGARGTGKTTALEALRLAFDKKGRTYFRPGGQRPSERKPNGGESESVV